MTLTEADPIIIVYAEDDEADRELFAEALGKAKVKARLTTVENGKALIQHLTKNTPDIIFTDINMPLLNGKECLHTLRRHSRFKNIPIIILSTSSFESDIEETYAGGANMYVVKPISFENHVENIKRIFCDNWRVKLFKHDRKEFFLNIEQMTGHKIHD
jgi:CheY-like chemotaxis protein